jgi:hypothetical protein
MLVQNMCMRMYVLPFWFNFIIFNFIWAMNKLGWEKSTEVNWKSLFYLHLYIIRKNFMHWDLIINDNNNKKKKSIISFLFLKK